MSIGSSSISEVSIAAQDDPNSKKTPPGQTAPVSLTSTSDPTIPTDPADPTGPTAGISTRSHNGHKTTSLVQSEIQQSRQIRPPPARVPARLRAHVGANFANFRALRELSP